MSFAQYNGTFGSALKSLPKPQSFSLQDLRGVFNVDVQDCPKNPNIW